MGSKASRHDGRDGQQRTVFQSNKAQNQVYRIPALFYDGECNLLMAFAEQRTTADDARAEVLVLKTGTLNTDGQSVTWSESRNVVEKSQLKGYRPMNPTPVYEKTSRTLFLFFICVEGTVSERWQRCRGINKARLCFTTTRDAGQTWSQVTDLTDEMPEIRRWATFAVGPGHGLQTESGRLVVPAYAYGSCSPCCFCISCSCTVSRALSIYSDDGGVTWRLGKMLEKKSVECEMAEVCDEAGSRYVYCNARNEHCYRVEAISDDNGEDFMVLPSAEKLVETGGGCQGSVISFPAQPEGASPGPGPRWLLYSHPTNQSKRLDLGIYLNKSPRNPEAWSSPWIINQGHSSYSDLAYVGDGRFVCLMERGAESYTEEIAYSVFSYDDVSAGVSK